MTGDFFTVLGAAAPAHGRLVALRNDDPGAPAVVVVSQRAWTTDFGRVFTVVGVCGNPLEGPAHDPDFWVPVAAMQQVLPARVDILLGPFGGWRHAVGRLGPSTSLGDAAALAALARGRLIADVPAVGTDDRRYLARPVDHVRLGPASHRDAARFLTTLAVITGIFLLAACSNMVRLLLTRGAEQAHELAVRRALGASRRDLVRPLAAELAVLVAAGGLAALPALRWVEPVLSALP